MTLIHIDDHLISAAKAAIVHTRPRTLASVLARRIGTCRGSIAEVFDSQDPNSTAIDVALRQCHEALTDGPITLDSFSKALGYLSRIACYRQPRLDVGAAFRFGYTGIQALDNSLDLLKRRQLDALEIRQELSVVTAFLAAVRSVYARTRGLRLTSAVDEAKSHIDDDDGDDDPTRFDGRS